MDFSRANDYAIIALIIHNYFHLYPVINAVGSRFLLIFIHSVIRKLNDYKTE